MATVYLALHQAEKGFRKLVALKVLRDQPGIDSDALRDRFAHEARVSARCHHRNVVQIHDVCDLDGKPALCMEYLDGQTYRQVKTRAIKTGALPLPEQVRILAEAAHGLHHVHTLADYGGRALGLVHCDVSPENVFITYDGQVKLLDFGIAQAHGERPAPPGFRGKLGYLAPELISGGPIDARADVFALGAMLWEAVSLLPFSGGPAVDDMTKVRTRLAGAEPDIRTLQPGMPEALAAIIDRALALEPTARFADAETFACALEDYLQRVRPQPSAQSLAKLVVPMFVRERSLLRMTLEPQLQVVDRWDREHASTFEQEPPLELEPPRSAPVPFASPTLDPRAFSDDPAFASPADTVSPDLRTRLRANSVAVLAIALALGVLGGVVLGWDTKSEPVLRANIPAPEPLPAASAPTPPPPAPVVRAEPSDDAARKAEACVAATRDLRQDLLHHFARDLVRTTAREERHRERRERRRAAQCAAGRTEKC